MASARSYFSHSWTMLLFFISKCRGYILLAVNQELCTIPEELQLWFSSACCSATGDGVRRSHNFGAAAPDSLERTLQPQLWDFT